MTCEWMLGCVAPDATTNANASTVSVSSMSESVTAAGENKDRQQPHQQQEPLPLTLPLPAPVHRIEELSCLLENKPSEWIPGNYGTFASRIVAFEDYLSNLPPQERVVAVVGHSQFFKAMRGRDCLFGNCDVWEVEWDGGCRGRDGVDGDGGTEAASLVEASKNQDNVVVPLGSKDDTSGAIVGLPRGCINLQKLYGYKPKAKKEEVAPVSS